MTTKVTRRPYLPPRMTTSSIGFNPHITRRTIEQRELLTLSKYAWPSVKSLGRLKPEPRHPLRTNYIRDRQRILHTRALEAEAFKTQVYTFPLSPHIHHRLFHTCKVDSIAETIAIGLALNTDLTRPIALGHDMGHPPFGHEGEKVLNKISTKYLGKPFKHNLHSVRIADVLEAKNLTHEVRNGIACHCGEKVDPVLRPGKIPEDLINLTDEDFPYTLEGCVVRISDQIAYLSHDLADAMRLKIITQEDFPKLVKEVFGVGPKQEVIPDRILDVLGMDVIEASRDRNYITMSPRMLEAREALFSFEYEKIIGSEPVQKARKRIPEIIETLFRYYTEKRKIDPRSAIDKIASYTDRQAKDRFNAVKRLYGVMRMPEISD